MTSTLHLLHQLQTYPTFTVRTIERLTGKDTTYAKVYLNRLKQRHLITHLQRNVYTLQTDPLIVASRITWPSYISLWTALRYHNLTEQTPHTITVVSPRTKHTTHLTYQHTTITFETIKPRYFFGFQKTQINGFDVFIADPEKALLDAVLLKKISVAEIYAILTEHHHVLNLPTLTDYIIRTHNHAVAKRFGWMLDSLQSKTAKKLQHLTYKTTIPLDYSRPPRGEKNTTWGLIINIGR